jgi:hypothetical protein
MLATPEEIPTNHANHSTFIAAGAIHNSGQELRRFRMLFLAKYLPIAIRLRAASNSSSGSAI